MKIINAGYQLIKEPSISKKIERIARVCYKSEDKIKDGTDIAMIKELVGRQHMAMLEHGDMAFEVGPGIYAALKNIKNNIESIAYDMNNTLKRNYLRFTEHHEEGWNQTRYVVSGNMRAWLETFDYSSLKSMDGAWPIPYGIYNVLTSVFPFLNEEERYEYHVVCDDCKYITDYSTLSDAERMVHETFSVLFTVDRGVTHELVRMRECSFAQESTRYCNYNLGKFGNEITVISPCFWDEDSDMYKEWKMAMADAEIHYFELTKLGAKPQEARDALPTSVKADIVMTTNLQEWKHVFNLRACDSTGPAHPQMHEIMVPLFKDMRTMYSFAFDNMIAYDECR